MANNLKFVPQAEWPAAALLTAASDGFNVKIVNSSSRKLFWSIETGQPTGNVNSYPPIEPGETDDVTMITGEELRVVIDGIPAGGAPEIVVIHD